ncbi:hypothetical protein ACVI3U_002887 [Sinorhizobium medicae]
MDWTAAIPKLIEQYGLPGIAIAVLLYVCRTLWVAFLEQAKKRAEDGVTIALAMERNTQAIEGNKQAIESLRDVIRERR